MAIPRKVAIIGAGICGVSCAVCLQDADPSLEITIIAEKFSPNLTSDGAAGCWEPVFVKCPIMKQKHWGKITFDYLKSILDTEDAYKYQMNYVTLFELHDHEVEKSPFSDIFLYCNRLSKDDLKKNNFPADIVDGFVLKSIMFPGTPYLNIQLKKFQHRGGKVIQKKVNSFDELAGKYDIVVNCAGIGSRELCNDHAVTPIRGQVLKMKAPWIKHGYCMSRQRDEKKEETTYIFPRFNDIVVGGTCQVGNWNTDVDDKQTRSMIDRVAELVPTIKHAVLVKPWVGLRPVRDTLRVERETVQVSSQYGAKHDLQVIHNYGHGGAGLSLFWGCAQEVKDLVLSSLLHSGL